MKKRKKYLIIDDINVVLTKRNAEYHEDLIRKVYTLASENKCAVVLVSSEPSAYT